MVSQQVRTWDVLDPRVLDTMGLIDRQMFVPPAYAKVAFADSRIPLPHDQVMLTPKVVGRLLQALDVGASDAVLEIGTGSGYLTACLADLAARVTSLEIHADLSEAAGKALDAAGITNATLNVEDGFEFAARERYNVIVVTGSLPHYDARFEQWLAPGGRLYVVSGQSPVMEATLVTRIDDETFDREALFETDVPALINAPREPSFSF